MRARTAPAAEMPVHFVGRFSALVRDVLQYLLLWPCVAWFCYPFLVRGVGNIPTGPVVFIANHASHADTGVILRALPWRIRRRTVVAAAEDHFWRVPALGGFVSLLTGAFPFPRSGCEGLHRTEAMLRRGNNVVVYPEGTRSKAATVAEFQRGAAILAERGATIVPVGLHGSADVLPKGATRPTRRTVSVVFGKPLDERVAEDAEKSRSSVEELVEIARREAETRRPTFFEAFRAFALSPAAVWLTVVWAFFEALVWPVVPDLLLLPLILVAPARSFALVAAAAAGSLAGGTVGYLAGSGSIGAHLLAAAPLVTDRMIASAGATLAERGAAGLLAQPLSGIPYKAFALQASPASVDLPGYLMMTAVARGARFAVVAAIAALMGRLFRPLWQRALPVFLPLYALSFAVGLGRVVASWEG